MYDRVQPSHCTNKEQNCITLANPLTQTSNQKISKTRKNVVFPDPEQQDISSVSKPIEIASSNDVTHGESLSEHLLVSG